MENKNTFIQDFKQFKSYWGLAFGRAFPKAWIRYGGFVGAILIPIIGIVVSLQNKPFVSFSELWARQDMIPYAYFLLTMFFLSLIFLAIEPVRIHKE